MSHLDTDQPRVDRDLRDQLVRENGLAPYYINDAERQDREAAREWLNESVFDWTLPEHEIQLAHEGSGGGGLWDGSMPVRLHTFDGVDNGYRSHRVSVPCTLHPVCRPQPIQPSNGRFYSLQPPPPGPATQGGSLAARGPPQGRSGSRAPAHPCAAGRGGRRKLLIYFGQAEGRRGGRPRGRGAGPHFDIVGPCGG